MTDERREHLVDARYLEPPGPLDAVLAALDDVAPDECLRLLIHREPFPLYGILGRMGYTHTTRELPDGTFDILFCPR